jgi:hypothetical protein
MKTKLADGSNVTIKLQNYGKKMELSVLMIANLEVYNP